MSQEREEFDRIWRKDKPKEKKVMSKDDRKLTYMILGVIVFALLLMTHHWNLKVHEEYAAVCAEYREYQEYTKEQFEEWKALKDTP